jgi:hypothetical protein
LPPGLGQLVSWSAGQLEAKVELGEILVVARLPPGSHALPEGGPWLAVPDPEDVAGVLNLETGVLLLHLDVVLLELGQHGCRCCAGPAW